MGRWEVLGRVVAVSFVVHVGYELEMVVQVVLIGHIAVVEAAVSIKVDVRRRVVG